MNPYYTDDWLTMYGGDCLDVMRTLPTDSVDCVVTSPPYWGLRDYGSEGQLGLERTPEEYVANMVNVFREVRRVLKPSGTCWLNLGDSYGGGNGGDTRSGFNARYHGKEYATDKQGDTARQLPDRPKLKPKDLVGIPWRVAFALQADGWYLRSDIIWSKPNPMPESVTDRPTKSHEYLFLLTKSARYYFDADAVREAHTAESIARVGRGRSDHHKWANGGPNGQTIADDLTHALHPNGRNIRSVWTIATQPYPGAHFAVFPSELPERCIKAGSSEKGVCPECGAPWERVVEKGALVSSGPNRVADKPRSQFRAPHQAERYGSIEAKPTDGYGDLPRRERTTTGWRPSCAHVRRDTDYTSSTYPPFDPAPAVILDPFAGSGTVGMVANRLSRRAILIDLNPEYLEQQMKRNAQTPLGLDAA